MRQSSSWGMRLPTLVCIPNHSVAVNHPFLDSGAGGIRYMSAPPTTTPSADTAQKEQVCQAMLKHPRMIKQLLALLHTHQAGTSKCLWDKDTSNGDPQHKAKRVKTSSFVAMQKAPAAQKQQQNPNALPVHKHFPEVSTLFLPLFPASHSTRTLWS